MENLDPNQLPMLPDPTEEPALPAGNTATPTPASAPAMPWFKTKIFRAGLISAGVIVVLLLVLFSHQLGQLLNLFGTKASTNQSVILDGTNFQDPGWTADPNETCFQVVDGKLMLNNTPPCTPRV